MCFGPPPGGGGGGDLAGGSDFAVSLKCSKMSKFHLARKSRKTFAGSVFIVAPTGAGRLR